MFIILLFIVIIPIIIISTFIAMGIILNKAFKFRKEQYELYQKEKTIIEHQYNKIKNEE